jgi:hypothetical protein
MTTSSCFAYMTHSIMPGVEMEIVEGSVRLHNHKHRCSSFVRMAPSLILQGLFDLNTHITFLFYIHE